MLVTITTENPAVRYFAIRPFSYKCGLGVFWRTETRLTRDTAVPLLIRIESRVTYILFHVRARDNFSKGVQSSVGEDCSVVCIL